VVAPELKNMFALLPAVELISPLALSVVKLPVFAVVAPTVPFKGPAKPVEVKIVPLNVKLAES
jgi:hypothetical protein